MQYFVHAQVGKLEMITALGDRIDRDHIFWTRTGLIAMGFVLEYII
jgi:hypothetical protein